MLRTATLRLARSHWFSWGLSCGSGAASALLVMAVLLQIRLAWGMGASVDKALLIGAGLCCFLYPKIWPWSGRRPDLPGAALIVASLCACLAPAALSAATRMFGMLPASVFDNPGARLLLLTFFATVLLAPAFGAAVCSLQTTSNFGRNEQLAWGLGCGGAGLLAPAMAFPWMTALTLLCATGIWGAMLLIAARFSCMPRPASDRQQLPVAEGDSQRAPGVELLIAFGCGAGAAVAWSVTAQLMPRSFLTDMSLLGGAGLGWTFAARTSFRRASREQTARWALQCAAWVAVLLLGFPAWIGASLRLNAFIGRLDLLLAGRALLLVLFSFPCGWLLGQLQRRPTGARRRPAATWIPVMAIAGCLVVLPWPWSARGAGRAVIVFNLIAAGLLLWRSGAFSLLRARVALPTFLWAAPACLGILCSGVFRPQEAERCLFSSNTFAAFRNGTAPGLLAWLDDARELAAFDLLTERTSLWRYRGSQLVVRRDGLAGEMRSGDPAICPQGVSDVLPALLPLVFHPDPEHVLVLGVHQASLETCHAWPLQTLTTAEESSAALRLLNWVRSQPSAGLQLDDGPDFLVRRTDPVLALQSRPQRLYDVIISPVVNPAASVAPAQLTREFYRHVSSHLAPTGVFSQRIPYYDLGPEALRQMISTLESVFPHVRAVEGVPGELTCLCSHGDELAVTEELAARLQLPQCRQTLASAGWDWSVVLGRGGLGQEALTAFTADQHRALSIADGRGACRLPLEIGRWGPKAEQTRAALAVHGQALRMELGDSDVAHDIEQRLEDQSLAYKLQAEHPDEPWAYRAALKERLKERPRSTILQVKHEGLKRVLDPEDQRRKEFLTALGHAAKQPQPALEQIGRVAAFEQPFDPLLSLFVHYETALLLTRGETPAPESELRHLLHTTYFAAPQDKSVCNVAAAVKLICEHPEFDLTSAERFDQINGLLQVLAARWQARLADTKSSRFEPIDVERSLRSTEAGLKQLEVDFRQAGLSTSDWSRRKDVLETALLRPLRRHYSEQLRRLPVAQPAAAAPPTTEGAP